MPAKGTKKCWYCRRFHLPEEHRDCRAAWIEREMRAQAKAMQVIDVDFSE